jgi:type IV pilus assembly protein PilW
MRSAVKLRFSDGAWPDRGVGARRRGQRGVTLVELMISLVIGMLVLSGVTYVFFASRTTYGYNETMSRIQENGRIALDALNFDIRMAGFFGCGKADLIPINVIANAPPIDKIDGGVAVTGYSYGDAAVAFVDAGALKGVAGSDVLVIRRVSPTALNLVGNLATANANIQVGSNPDNFVAGDVLMVTDCTVGDLFRATNVSAGGGKVTLAHAESSNSTNRLSKTYGPDAQLMRFQEIAFFLRQTSRTTRDGTPITSLFRRVNGVDEEIVDGVADMRVFYALDSAVDSFVAKGAVGDWARVVAVRVHLLMSTQEQTLTEAHSPRFIKPGAAAPDELQDLPANKIMRQEFFQTIALRNRLP